MLPECLCSGCKFVKQIVRTMKIKRQIVEIDEALCNGYDACISRYKIVINHKI